jgi:hypothetical protein
MGPGADVLPQFYPEQRRLQLAFKIEFEIVTVFGNRRVLGSVRASMTQKHLPGPLL